MAWTSAIANRKDASRGINRGTVARDVLAGDGVGIGVERRSAALNAAAARDPPLSTAFSRRILFMSVFLPAGLSSASGHGGFQRCELPVAAGKGVSVTISGGLGLGSLPENRP